MTKKMTPEEIKQAFPECCRIVDEFREVFGPDVKPLYMCEGGKEIGRRPERSPTAVKVSQMVFEEKPKEKKAPPARVRNRDKWEAGAPKPKYIEEP